MHLPTNVWQYMTSQLSVLQALKTAGSLSFSGDMYEGKEMKQTDTPRECAESKQHGTKRHLNVSSPTAMVATLAACGLVLAATFCMTGRVSSKPIQFLVCARLSATWQTH